MDPISPSFRSHAPIADPFRLARISLLVLLVLAMAVPGGLHAEKAEPRDNIDRILAVIGNHVILHSDVLIHAEILKRSRKSILPESEIFTGAGEKAFRKHVFKEIVIRQIVYAETVKLNLAEVEQGPVDEAMAELKQTFDSQKEFERFCYLLGVREEQILFLVRQRLICEAYIEKKIGLQVRINRRTWFEEHKDRYPALPLDQIQDRVDKDLYAEKLGAWLEDILKRTDMKIMEDFYKDALE